MKTPEGFPSEGQDGLNLAVASRGGAPLPQGLLFGFFASLALAFAFSLLAFCFLPFSLSFLPPLSPIDHLRPVPGAVCSAWEIPRLIVVSRRSAGSARIHLARCLSGCVPGTSSWGTSS